MVVEAEKHLRRAGIDVTVIGKDGPQRRDAAVYVGTLHRFKGLEFEKMIVAGAADGLIPAARIASLKVTDPVRYEREARQARSLLFVAATRARDELVITWHGTPSPFLPEVPRS
jgi:superfamily I DNA/RNA helicase